ncbi:hypothetical protein Hypma_007593 [Hypsizygus marmoreus]|uniref:C3H1-type domain-containing protein n=1 Tax=Hypsizygus marmoreus TaxID=39966 RepID=A0A369K057_HYPMA|nr:hypothetical protein Hypma_007593 [Hypsizygus marmoreus]
MPFGLTIGTERAIALQQSIQDELTTRGYSPDADPVMAEYITIMVINNKTAAQITTELEDLIGSDFDPSFTEWLFIEAAKGAIEAVEPPQPEPSSSERPLEAAPPRDVPPHITPDTSRRPLNPPRNGVYQQALSQALPNSVLSGQKRTASARSPSPNHPNKSRRTDVPTGPRAMLRDGSSASSTTHANPRSLLDRVGGPAAPMRNAGSNGFHDDIQSRIDDIVNSSPDQNMMMGGFPGMDMNAMAAANMANPLVLQEMMMNQMALMAQMASTMGMLNAPGQFVGPGFPMQGMPGDMGMFPGGGMAQGFQGPAQIGGSGMGGRGRGGGRGGRGGSGRGRGGSTSSSTTPKIVEVTPPTDSAPSPSIPIAAPAPRTPSIASTALTSSTAPSRPAVALPERPQSPTLCKFSMKCTNPHCRYAHPSPVATAESGVVLSNEACEKGKDCQDKDCIKGHVSPSVLNPQASEQVTPTPVTPQSTAVSCRFGSGCTRPGCPFAHPTRPTVQAQNTHFNQQCRFGAGCTRATCPFQHPEGRVLPTAFHRGLSTTGPMVSVPTPEAGSMGTSHHKSVKFNKPTGPGLGVKEKLQKQMKEIEERKSEAEKAVREAEAAAAAGKKDESKPVAIAA